MTAPRILVVEDERIIALHLRQQLTRLGYDVPNTVSTGDHALRRIEEAPPDLVLMDINLKGGLDGIATTAAIRRSYSIPVIYLTAYSADEMLQRAAATNPHGYLLKPFSERELHAMIQVTLARCQTERASLAARERLQQTRKMEALSQLAGGIAAEVDELLTMLYGQLEVLGGHAIDDPDLAEPIRETFGEAIEKERLVRQLFEFCGRRKLAPVTISVAGLTARVRTRLRQIMGDTIAIRLRLADDLWPVRIDPDRFAQAMAHLATNAREAMPDGGSLTIEAQNTVIDQDRLHDAAGTGRHVMLSVTDTGTGMPEAVVERAFELFFTTRPSGAGNGLGLSLVFGFVRQSGGHISIDSKPGSGTTVRIYLPAASGDGLTAAPDAAPQRAVQGNEPEPAASGTGGGIAGDLVVAAGGTLRGQRNQTLVTDTPTQRTAAPVMWHRTEKAVFASVLGSPGKVRYRLIVEPLPRQNGWDWTVWRPDSDGRQSRHGRASSVVSAMAAAEDAAGHWVNASSRNDQPDTSDCDP